MVGPYSIPSMVGFWAPSSMLVEACVGFPKAYVRGTYLLRPIISDFGWVWTNSNDTSHIVAMMVRIYVRSLADVSRHYE